MAALWLWQLLHHLPIINTGLQQAIDQHAHNTTDISRHYLERALQGHFQNRFASYSHNWLGRIGNDNRIRAEQVMQFGATSGVDCLAGMLHGFRTLNTMN
ncbi:hypothetical protein DMI62_02770 [Escherichia coli]|nr:hypothetical protein [Escherichia coli]